MNVYTHTDEKTGWFVITVCEKGQEMKEDAPRFALSKKMALKVRDEISQTYPDRNDPFARYA